MNILVSACLLGVNCRYDGKNHFQEKLEKLAKIHTVIPVCPEQLGGLPTPREPVELKLNADGKIQAITKDGKIKTKEFQKGAKETSRIAQVMNCEAAILKEKSPSCGTHKIYDGTFQGVLITGHGMTAQALLDMQIPIYTEESMEELF